MSVSLHEQRVSVLPPHTLCHTQEAVAMDVGSFAILPVIYGSGVHGPVGTLRLERCNVRAYVSIVGCISAVSTYMRWCALPRLWSDGLKIPCLRQLAASLTWSHVLLEIQLYGAFTCLPLGLRVSVNTSRT